jgi:6-phosphogluconolactonase
MNGELHVFETTDRLFHAAAAKLVEEARSAIAARSRFTVALAGGSTPQTLYELLAVEPYRSQVAWSKVEWFWGDERAVGPDDPESNFRMARQALLSKVEADASKVHRLCGEAVPLATAAEEYQRELARVFGVPTDGPPPSFDLVLLGMGGDGHTASLFPFTAALDEQKRWVTANDVPQLNARRLTVTYPVLNAAASVVFLVTGVGKAKVLREVLQGPHDPRRLPSQAVRPAGSLHWFVDHSAASQLE